MTSINFFQPDETKLSLLKDIESKGDFKEMIKESISGQIKHVFTAVKISLSDPD